MRWESEFGKNGLQKCNLHSDENWALFSRLSSLQGNFQAKQYGIKYVIKGTEKYHLKKQVFCVNEGEFLLVNKGQDFECSFNERQTVHGLCISLDDTFLRNIFSYLHTSEEYLLDNASILKTEFPEFHEAVYSATEPFSNYLRKKAGCLIEAQNIDAFDALEFYQDLAMQLLITHQTTISQIERIKASKSATKKELYNRLYMAKMMIDAGPSKKLNIPELAKECALSEFHFYRSFKCAFGISPNQYAIAKRLEKALQLLRTKNSSITEIAYETGFTDIYSFSKSFKKFYKASPTEMMLCN